MTAPSRKASIGQRVRETGDGDEGPEGSPPDSSAAGLLIGTTGRGYPSGGRWRSSRAAWGSSAGLSPGSNGDRQRSDPTTQTPLRASIIATQGSGEEPVTAFQEPSKGRRRVRDDPSPGDSRGQLRRM